MIHIVLFQPEIPGNTGNILRTAMASGCTVDLIEPLGFSLEDKYLRRSGMDYIKDCEMHRYPYWDTFEATVQGPMVFLTRYGRKPPSSFDFTDDGRNLYLVFGKESTGVDKRILKRHLDTCLRLPMIETARSLNLSNAVAVTVYEVLRQRGYPGLSFSEQLKGESFLEDLELD